MPTRISVQNGGLSLVDYSLDPQIILGSLEFAIEWYAWYDFYSRILEYFTRLPTAEYAVGFDGVDDYVSVPSLEIGNHGIEMETNIWISRENQGSPLLSIVNSNERRILTLAASNEENFRINAFYRNGGDIENEPIQNIALEEWQQLYLESDGEVLSITVDGDQELFITQIDLEDGPFKLEFGRGNSPGYFEGMVRNLKVSSGDNEVFCLQSGKDVNVEDETNSAVITGVHNIKKDRLEKEFR